METTIAHSIKNNWLSPLGQNQEASINETQVFANVDGLSLFDMDSIYHHINYNSILKLSYNYKAIKGEQVEVWYKNFKLGFITGSTGKTIEDMLLHGFDLRVKITLIEKYKYLPINRLEVVVEDNLLAVA